MKLSEFYDQMAPKLTGKKEGTFAYITVRDRWPKIVAKLVDQLACRRYDYVEQYGEDVVEDVRSIIEKLSEVRYRIMTDKPLVYLSSGSGEWDQFLTDNMTLDPTDSNSVEKLTWFNGPWLLVECYLYQFINAAFLNTKHLKSLDYFEDSKKTNFNDHLHQIEETVAFLSVILKEGNISKYIDTIFKMSLWGNRADMSLTGGDNNTLKVSGMNATTSLAEFVLVDDVDKLIQDVLTPLRDKKTSRRIDIILDNAGVELSGDLVLAEFLLSYGYADSIVLHGKNIPWFVSDVTKTDFEWTLKSFKNAGDASRAFGETLSKRVEDGQIRFESHKFWTFPHPYCDMEAVSPDLYNDLKKSSLVIFKGDLNYRKLVGDRDWDLETPFDEACCGFRPSPFFALRTLKSETVAGLSHESVGKILMKFDDDNSWMTSGDYAVCQLGGIQNLTEN